MLADSTNPIRIAHILGKMMAGGVESMVMNYFRHIDKSRIVFDFIIDSDSTVVPREEIEALGGRIVTVAPYQDLTRYCRELITVLRAGQYRIVHSHINAMSVFSLFAAKQAGVPVRIAHSHSTSGKGEFAKNVMKATLRPFSRVFPTHYCACTPHAAKWLFGRKLTEIGRVDIIKNAINLTNYAYDSDVRAAARAALKLEDSLVIGHVGRFMKQKNHMFLLDIFAEVLKREANAVLLLVGEGELEEDVKAKARALGIPDKLRFLGVRNDVHTLMQAMDVFLFPSLYEGLGIVAIEAQTAGLLTMVSDQVPQEANITEMFYSYSLQQPASQWAREILKHIGYIRTNHATAAMSEGYDICEAADKLRIYYEKYYREVTTS